MKKLMISIFLVITICLCGIGNCFAQTITAKDVVKRVWELYRGVKNETDYLSIRIIERDRSIRKELSRWIKYDENYNDKVMIKFRQPKSDEGLGLLILRNSKNDKSYLKKASWKRVRRVSIKDKSKYFAGTDFTFKDLEDSMGIKIENYDYTFLKNKKDAFWTIELIPKDKNKAVYGKIVYEVRTDFVLTKVIYYDFLGKLIKQQKNKFIKTIKDGLWRANIIVIDNFILDRQTIVETKTRELDILRMRASFFNKSFLLKK